MDKDGKITISDLSRAYYVYYKSRLNRVSKEEVKHALEVIGNAPIEVKRQFETVRKRKQRLRIRLTKLFEEEESLYFLTLTFSDEFVNRSDDLINKFKRQLKKENIKFIINEDFGGQFGRVHFHCILNRRIKVLQYWNYGGFKNIKIKKSNNSLIKLPDYFNKLTNHTLKESNKRIKVYYNL